MLRTAVAKKKQGEGRGEEGGRGKERETDSERGVGCKSVLIFLCSFNNVFAFSS